MSLSGQFAGKTALVTGASQGIGRATAIELAKTGARVFVADKHLRQENHREFGHWSISETQCDVSRTPELESWVRAAFDLTGRIDILVNNAGIVMTGQVTDVCERDWDACLSVNLKAAFFGCKFAIPYMRQNGGGVIVNVSSNAGLLPRAHDPVYCISKSALIGLTRSLALCHARDRIRVSAVCPGPVGETGIMEQELSSQADPVAAAERYIAASPLAKAHGRMIKPDEVAKSICYLCSDAALLVTGAILAIDGGKSLGVPPG